MCVPSYSHSSRTSRKLSSLDEQHAHLLTPSFALSGSLPTDVPTYDNMTPAELEAFLAEMEPDIRAADRDLREIEILEKKDVTGAGKLPEYETLQPRLDALFTAHAEDLEKAGELEKRIAKLMDRYATNVRWSQFLIPRVENSIILVGGYVVRTICCMG